MGPVAGLYIYIYIWGAYIGLHQVFSRDTGSIQGLSREMKAFGNQAPQPPESVPRKRHMIIIVSNFGGWDCVNLLFTQR